MHFIKGHSNSFLQTDSSMNMNDDLTTDPGSLTSVPGRSGHYSALKLSSRPLWVESSQLYSLRT